MWSLGPIRELGIKVRAHATNFNYPAEYLINKLCCACVCLRLKNMNLSVINAQCETGAAKALFTHCASLLSGPLFFSPTSYLCTFVHLM